jgi:hypothetical protein
MRISGPYAHDNLVLFFLHGPSRPGPVPLTLEEALAKGKVDVKETGVVSELSIENVGEDDVFIQSGDIVKGGRQDRVLKASIVLSPKSAPVPVSALCVESGRWSSRAYEDVGRFSKSSDRLYDRMGKSAIKRAYSRQPIRNEQALVWDRVEASQAFLYRSLGKTVQAAVSPTSLQLSLESVELEQAQAAYVDRLSLAGMSGSDTVGMVWAVNGRLSGGEVYPSNALFRKMLAKNLKASAAEAIAEKVEKPAPAPTVGAVQAFLASAEQGELSEADLPGPAKIATRIGEKTVFSEARRMDGTWVHRGYVAA